MSSFERLLAPDCTEGPECRCGKEMHIAGVDEVSDRTDAQIRIYKVQRANMRCGSRFGPSD